VPAPRGVGVTPTVRSTGRLATLRPALACCATMRGDPTMRVRSPTSCRRRAGGTVRRSRGSAMR